MIDRGVLRMVVQIDLKKPVLGQEIVEAFRKAVPDEEVRWEKSSDAYVALGASSGLTLVWDLGVVAVPGIFRPWGQNVYGRRFFLEKRAI